jgi:hypothetical protein
MIKQNKISRKLIAICGMNCRLCSAYKRKKNACLGCRAEIGSRLSSCERCNIRNCDQAVDGKLLYCYQCESYPCERIKHIDKRYRTKYGMSMIENLGLIKVAGIRKFLINEQIKWNCPRCGQILTVHKPHCLTCQYVWR